MTINDLRQWQHDPHVQARVRRLIGDAADRIELLENALLKCAAKYQSPPCAVTDGAAHVAQEFQRRMQIAHDAVYADQ